MAAGPRATSCARRAHRSAGNMAQGVAWCAGGRACRAPSSCPTTRRRPSRRDRAARRGMVKVPYERWWRAIETRAIQASTASSSTPFADPGVMAGNGTIGLEILEDFPDPMRYFVPSAAADCRRDRQRHARAQPPYADLRRRAGDRAPGSTRRSRPARLPTPTSSRHGSTGRAAAASCRRCSSACADSSTARFTARSRRPRRRCGCWPSARASSPRARGRWPSPRRSRTGSERARGVRRVRREHRSLDARTDPAQRALGPRSGQLVGEAVDLVGACCSG